MSTIVAKPNSHPTVSAAVALSTAQTGTGDSTNTADRRALGGAAALIITTTVGATPTVTVAIQGSADGTNWWNVAYGLVATPNTVAVANIVITSAVTTNYLLLPNQPWRYLKLVLSANTNVTLTANLYCSPN
jgi:hypothetical protein